VRVTAEELRRHCRPARLSTILEQANSHYAERPVLVVLNHAVRPRKVPDPLYASAEIGGFHNVLLIANDAGFERARADGGLEPAPPSPIPPVWRDLLLALLAE
jgi:hypothetical protein